MTESSPVGRVVGLWRYPVKSMAPEPLERADVSWQGLAGDRRWAFVRDGLQQSGFPWLTLRQNPLMSRYRPSLIDPDRPDESPTIVRAPSGATFDVTDPELAAELHPTGARVMRQARGAFDAFPLSLISIQSVEALGGLVGYGLAVGRFRPNILVETTSGEPFVEDEWVGSVIRVGAVSARIDKRDGRCVVITTDPITGERSPEILRAVVEERDGCLGVYGTVVTEGQITVGDEVFLA